jgi:hypothetical protein
MARYRWDRDRQELVEVTRDKPPRGGFFMPDIAEFQSPIDGSLISSRSTLRAHEQRHGVRQCGELKTAADFDWRPKSSGPMLDSHWSDYE